MLLDQSSGDGEDRTGDGGGGGKQRRVAILYRVVGGSVGVDGPQ